MRTGIVIVALLACLLVGDWAQISDDDPLERLLLQGRKLTFAQDIYPLLIPYLNQSGLLGAPSNTMNVAKAYSKLINVPLQSDPGTKLVVPGDAQHSALWAALRNGTYSSQPGRSPTLDSIQLQEVKTWIDEGALFLIDDKGVVAVPGPNGGLIRGGNVVTPFVSTILAVIGTLAVVLASAGYLYIKA